MPLVSAHERDRVVRDVDSFLAGAVPRLRRIEIEGNKTEKCYIVSRFIAICSEVDKNVYRSRRRKLFKNFAKFAVFGARQNNMILLALSAVESAARWTVLDRYLSGLPTQGPVNRKAG